MREHGFVIVSKDDDSGNPAELDGRLRHRRG